VATNRLVQPGLWQSHTFGGMTLKSNKPTQNHLDFFVQARVVSEVIQESKQIRWRFLAKKLVIMNEGESPNSNNAQEMPERYEVFVKLLVKHEPETRSFLRGLLPKWHDVEEVIQEASLIAWKKFDRFEEGTAFGGWLLTIARYEALRPAETCLNNKKSGPKISPRKTYAHLTTKSHIDVFSLVNDGSAQWPAPK
jgi:hypothetical protein